MKKPLRHKKQVIKQLKQVIGLSRKLARQINRKLASLAELNQAKAAIKKQLVDICEGKR